LRNGDRTAAEADFTAAKASRAVIAEEFVRYGVPADGVVRTAAPPVSPTAPPVPSTAPTTTAAPTPAASCARAETHWKSAEDLKSAAIYEDHIARFPNCEFATLAKARLEALKR
jgi:1,4-alpha-glucan branching enzyme